MIPSELTLVPGEGCVLREPGAVRWRLVPAHGSGRLDPLEAPAGECLYLAPRHPVMDRVTVLAQDANGTVLGAACIHLVVRRRPGGSESSAADGGREGPMGGLGSGELHDFHAPRLGGLGPRAVTVRAKQWAVQDCQHRFAFDRTLGHGIRFSSPPTKLGTAGFRAALLTACLFLL